MILDPWRGLMSLGDMDRSGIEGTMNFWEGPAPLGPRNLQVAPHKILHNPLALLLFVFFFLLLLLLPL